MKKFLTLALTAVMALSLLTACGSKNDNSADTNTDGSNTETTLSGTVSTDGSTSMEKVINSLGESFMAMNKDVKFTYNPTGSGSGIQAVSEGRCDIGLSSRALKDDEKASGLVETVVALDGIAIVVNPENPVSDLDIDTIAKIYTGEITNWKDVGGNDAEIVLIGREAGSGITAVQDGTCDIGLSSRALKDEEKSAGLKETVLAYDGIAIIVHPDNPVSDLSIDQIAKLYTGEITNWKDVGGNDAEVVLIGREAASGTRDGFESITGTKDKCQYRQELTSTGDVITAVSQNPDAIGYASLASIKDTVKALNVDGVTPSEATVKDGSYKVQRPFVLVTVDGKALSPAAQAFFDYATSSGAASIIAKAGAVAVAG